MSTYVYLPYSGTLTSYYGGSLLTCNCSTYWKYCGGTTCHPCVYGQNPIDLDVPDNTWIDFYVDPSCRSVVGVAHNGIMCSGSPGSPYDNAFELKMYTGTGGTGSYIGSFIYGHCNATFTYAIDTVPISGTPLYGLTQVAYVQAGWISGCYEGSHVHMESVNASGVASGWGCGGTPSWIYQYP